MKVNQHPSHRKKRRNRSDVARYGFLFQEVKTPGEVPRQQPQSSPGQTSPERLVLRAQGDGILYLHYSPFETLRLTITQRNVRCPTRTSLTSKSRRDLAASLRGSRPRKHARLRHRRLQAERLEDRRLLSLSPLDSIPVLNSNSSASASLYLDFNGHFESVWGSYTNVTTPVYDVDGDRTTFSDLELANIRDIWSIVAEDYAPFNINVTTVEPAVLAAGVPSSAANGVALRVAIGGTSQEVLNMSYAGYAYYNSFTSSTANVAYVFPESLTGWPAVMVGNCASHEAGHSFGLRHQSYGGVYKLDGDHVCQSCISKISGGRRAPMILETTRTTWPCLPIP